MTKLIFVPEKSGYSVKDGDELVSVQLAGGAPRTRLDVLGAWSRITATWELGPDEYEYMRTFYKNAVAKGGAPFQIDLLLDQAGLTTHNAKFVPGSFGLSGQRGLTFTVNAELDVEPIARDANFDESLVEIVSIGETLDGGVKFLSDLSNFVNVTVDKL